MIQSYDTAHKSNTLIHELNYILQLDYKFPVSKYNIQTPDFWDYKCVQEESSFEFCPQHEVTLKRNFKFCAYFLNS